MTLPLADVVAAHQTVEAGKTMGNVVLEVAGRRADRPPAQSADVNNGAIRSSLLRPPGAHASITTMPSSTRAG
jgi:hypothetical protein